MVQKKSLADQADIADDYILKNTVKSQNLREINLCSIRQNHVPIFNSLKERKSYFLKFTFKLKNNNYY